jgi:hypothetical protein
MDGEMYLAKAPPISVVIWPPALSSGISAVTRVNGLEAAPSVRWQAFVLAFAHGLAATGFSLIVSTCAAGLLLILGLIEYAFRARLRRSSVQAEA